MSTEFTPFTQDTESGMEALYEYMNALVAKNAPGQIPLSSDNLFEVTFSHPYNRAINLIKAIQLMSDVTVGDNIGIKRAKDIAQGSHKLVVRGLPGVLKILVMVNHLNSLLDTGREPSNFDTLTVSFTAYHMPNDVTIL